MPLWRENFGTSSRSALSSFGVGKRRRHLFVGRTSRGEDETPERSLFIRGSVIVQPGHQDF